MANSSNEEYTPIKEIHFDESFNDFTDVDTGMLIIDLPKFIEIALLNQNSIQITKIKSLHWS